MRGVALSDSVDLLNIDFNPTDLNFRIVTYIQSQSIFPLRIYKIVGKWQLHIYDRSVDDVSISHRALCIQDSRWPRVSLSTSEQLELLRRYDASWKNIEWWEHNTVFFIPRNYPGNSSMEMFRHTTEEDTLSISYSCRLAYTEFPCVRWTLDLPCETLAWTHPMTYWRSRTTLESTSTSCPLFLIPIIF